MAFFWKIVIAVLLVTKLEFYTWEAVQSFLSEGWGLNAGTWKAVVLLAVPVSGFYIFICFMAVCDDLHRMQRTYRTLLPSEHGGVDD